jgi:hypothetical protein
MPRKPSAQGSLILRPASYAAVPAPRQTVQRRQAGQEWDQ